MAIEGVVIKQVTVHQSNDGFFAELVKAGEETYHEIRQTSYSETLPGVIKAFHNHKGYWEIWCVIKGRAKIVLADIREGSSTQGKTDTIITGEDDMKVIAIPPGVAHGYQVLGSTSLGIVYHAGKGHDPANPGIEEIPHDSSMIGYDWNAKI